LEPTTYTSAAPPTSSSPPATDQHFFTNAPGYTLLDRFRATLVSARFFDVLVGYFRLSGFQQLAPQLLGTDKVRILVGMEVDRPILTATQAADAAPELDFRSHQQHREAYADTVRREATDSPDAPEVEESLRSMLAYLQRPCPGGEAADRALGQNGRHLEIRVVPTRDVHAKVYITRYKEPVATVQPATVVTGSSNFTYPGLRGQREFNVELRSSYDCQFALAQFEELWRTGVDVSEVAVAAVQRATWLRDDISPYELYLKLLYEYFEEQINAAEDDEDLYLPDDFRRLRYQTSAALDAKRVLETYNGVFLADVVGLGKTFVTALLLQQLPGRKLIVCPPLLMDYWEDALRDFGVQRFKVVSAYKLDEVLANDSAGRFQYVVVDEAHRFRNEGTQLYDKLHRLCQGRRVVLVSATPLNNTIRDIRHLVKLFQPPRHSTVPGLPNLEGFFVPLEKRVEEARLALRRAEQAADPDLIVEARARLRVVVREVADQVRDRVLKHLMVRRTRTDIRKHFADDLKAQGLHFPKMGTPQRIIYEFSDGTEQAFINTVRELRGFHYARYQPLTFLRRELSSFEEAAQRNVGDFMRGLLVKRLESSFYAFRRSLDRFILSYQHFLKMLRSGTVYLGKEARLYEMLENDDVEAIERLLDKGKLTEYQSTDFRPDFEDALVQDLGTLLAIRAMWAAVDDDPKLDAFLEQLRKDAVLKKERMVIFTESKETGDYLFDALNAVYPNEVLFVASHGGCYGKEKTNLSVPSARDMVLQNFDPRYAKSRQSGQVRFLVTTDVLAEGINLHRACVLLNYDLPWNPTRVLQRAGRVNRIGTQHQQVSIYNFFPTTQSDQHLGLENNVINKIQLFHDLLGEDAQYLSEGEQVSSRELFQKLNDPATYEGEQGEDSELPYLALIRQVRDEQPELFAKLRELPRKARCAYRPMPPAGAEAAGLLTFFRSGRLRKFFTAPDGPDQPAQELTFFEAVQRLRATPKHPAGKLPPTYYDLLAANKAAFAASLVADAEPVAPVGSTGNPHLRQLIPLVRKFGISHKAQFTDSNEEQLRWALQILQSGAIAKLSAKKLYEKLSQPRVYNNPAQFLQALADGLGSYEPVAATQVAATPAAQEVILSAYLIGAKGP
jgi:superfamily II DNA or RNA helicase